MPLGADPGQRWRDGEATDRLLLDVFMDAHPDAPKQVVLDLDVTDTPLHGQQEGRFFHSFYDEYCYYICRA